MEFFEINSKEEIVDFNIPFCISHYNIEKYEDLDIRENASLYLFYIIEGKGYIDDIHWEEGDLFIYPYSPNGIKLYTSEDTKLYCIHNSPLLESMGVRPYRSLFKPKIYLTEEMIDSKNIKKIFIKPDKIETIQIKNNSYLLCISGCYQNIKSYIQQKEILWEKGKLIFIKKNNFITFYNKNLEDIIFLLIK